MKKLGRFLVLESAEDLKDAEGLNDDNGNYYTRIYGVGMVHHKGDRQNYPQYYKYVEPWDSHCCGDFVKCSKEMIIEYYEEEIKKMKEIIENL